MKLEDQLAALAEHGISLADGVSVDDLLYSFDRGTYETKPFDLLLFVLGVQIEREPWGRNFSTQIWNFDRRAITGTGCYVGIATQLCRIAATPDRLQHLADEVDFESGEAWLSYSVDGQKRHWKAEVNHKWSDAMVISYLVDDIEETGRHFYGKDNGDATVVFYLDDAQANWLNEVTGDALTRLTS